MVLISADGVAAAFYQSEQTVALEALVLVVVLAAVATVVAKQQ
jgi:hypothetical protein